MFSTVRSALPIVLESWGLAGPLFEGKVIEDMAFTGEHTSLAVHGQAMQAMHLSYQLLALLKASHKMHNEYLMLAGALGTPVVVGLLKHKTGKSSQSDAKVIRWVHTNLGSLCQISSLIVSVSLLRLGHVAYAVTSLSILSFGYLSRRKCIPLCVARAYSHINFWASSVGSLLNPSWLAQLCALSEMYDRVHSFWYPNQVPYDQASHLSCLLSLKRFNEIASEIAPVQVKRDHVHVAPFPSFPLANTQDLIAFCEAFEWDRMQLAQEIEKDARWSVSEQKGACDKALSDTDRQAIQVDYAKNQFKALVTSVQNESIETGEVLDYGVLKNYLGCIGAKLPLASQDIQDQVMIQLASDGGEYCGPGIYYQLEMAAQSLLVSEKPSAEEPKRLPLKQRILLLLQQERLRIIEGFHLALAMVDPCVHERLGGTGGVHGRNYTARLLVLC